MNKIQKNKNRTKRKHNRVQGTVKWYDIKRCYGYIQDTTGQQVFVHKNEVPFWSIFLKPGDRVLFTKHHSKKGIQAKNLTIL